MDICVLGEKLGAKKGEEGSWYEYVLDAAKKGNDEAKKAAARYILTHDHLSSDEKEMAVYWLKELADNDEEIQACIKLHPELFN